MRIPLSGVADTRILPLVLQLAGAGPSLSQPADATEPPAAAGIEVSGLVDVYYAYDANRVDPALRSFDLRHDAFTLSLAEVALARPAGVDRRVGFRIDLDFGETAGAVAATEPSAAAREDFRHVQQAYVSIQAGKKVLIDAGRFVTPLGAEVIESRDNWNYSRSALFGYAIPFHHVGVRAALAAGDALVLNAYVVNGWNNSVDLDRDKTLGLGAAWKPANGVTWVATAMSGRESPAATADRLIIDSTVTVSVTPRLTLMANGDYGTEGDTSWAGLAAYARYQVTSAWDLAGRFEYLDDGDGGFMTLGRTARTVTLTSGHRVADDLDLRLEYRGDFTDEPFFTDRDGDLKTSQSAALMALVYSFGGRL